MEKRKINWTAIGSFTFSLLWLLEGIIFLVKDRAIIGVSRGSTLNVLGGWLIVLVGIIFLYVSYHTLSPFGKIREFLEGGKQSKLPPEKEEQ